jgi:hypothetical protein
MPWQQQQPQQRQACWYIKSHDPTKETLLPKLHMLNPQCSDWDMPSHATPRRPT